VTNIFFKQKEVQMVNQLQYPITI